MFQQFVSAISLNSVSVKAQPKKAFGLSIGRIAMSKAQKGNKENKKPKADKSQSKANVSATGRRKTKAWPAAPR